MNTNENTATDRKMYERVYGSKYDVNLSTADVAKLVRQEITAARKAGTLPKGLRVSVKTKNFSGGSSITLTITALPAGMEIFNPAWFEAEARNQTWATAAKRYSDDVNAICETVHGFAEAYNHDGSESMVDYFDVNFYCHACTLDWRKFSDAEAAAVQAAKVAVAASNQS